MNYIVYVADRLEHHRAAALDRDIDIERSILDRGATITRIRPEVTPLQAIGVWFRSRHAAARPGFSY